MNRTKQLTATAAALIMAVGMAAGTSVMTASAAAEDVTITVSANDDHTYEAYQIFAGNVDTVDGSKVIMPDSELRLGNGVNENAFYAALGLTGADKTPANALDVLKDKTGEEIADILKGNGVLKTKVTLAQGDNSGLVSGYVYIQETSSEPQLNGVVGDLLKITNDVAISPKIGAPGVEKKVKENARTIDSDGTKIGATYEAGYNDAADYNVGDMVPFTIYGTIPADFDSYDHYFYEFSDRLAPGFSTVNAGDIHVFVDDTEITAGFNVSVTDKTETGQTSDSHFITVTFNDLKDASLNITKDTKIKFQYEAQLGENAVMTKEGNTNEVYLTYTTDHNYKGYGFTDSGKEKKTPDDETGDDTKPPKDDQTDDTQPDGTVVFTYDLLIDKIDAATGADLEGAQFVLFNEDQTKIAKIVSTNTGNKIDSWEDATNLTDPTEFKFTIPYTKGKENHFEIKGIDSGKYSLVETDAPAGYVKLTQPVAFEVTTADAAGSDNINITGDAEWSSTGLKTDDGSKAWADGTWVNILTTDNAAAAQVTRDGSLDIDIANVSGVQLPETGGIGTKMFYGIGGATVLVSSVLLIAKKRMKKAE
jgi:fimbrial isopeptide formation D2 family protein/LPXTG-motif cell wall-anchored protein